MGSILYVAVCKSIENISSLMDKYQRRCIPIIIIVLQTDFTNTIYSTTIGILYLVVVF